MGRIYDHNNAGKFRQVAEEIRLSAETMRAERRQIMLRIADEYDWMAYMAEWSNWYADARGTG